MNSKPLLKIYMQLLLWRIKLFDKWEVVNVL